MRNLISAQEVIDLAFAESSNMREDSISATSISVAEIKYIRPAFGAMFPLLGEKYADFTNEYVKPALAYFVKCEIIASIAIDMSNSGVAVANPQYQSAATDKQRQRLYDSEMSKAKTLLDFALEYIATHSEEFPDFSGTAPKKHYRLGGLILGNGGGSRSQSASIAGDAFKEEFDKYIKDMQAITEALGKKVDKTDYQQDKETTAQHLSNKVDKISGKGLSSNDYSDSDKQAVASMPFEKGEAENSAVAKNNSNQATATGAMSIGYKCSAETVYSFAGGKNSKTTNKASSSFAFGEGNTAEAYQSVALNQGTRAGGNYSMSVGNGTETNNPAEFACGKHNSSTPDTLFSVGNGTEEEKFNAFEVRKDNTAYVGGVKILNANEVDDAIKKATAGGGGGSGASLLVEVTHSELVSLRDSEQLTAGQMYRITDYITLIAPNNEGYSSMEHPFDIIVTALDKSTLSEKAKAIAHEGCTMYDDFNLSAWELHYSLDNDFTEWCLKEPQGGGWRGNNGALLKESVITNDEGNELYLYAPSNISGNWLGATPYRTEDVVVTDVNKLRVFYYDEDGAYYLVDDVGNRLASLEQETNYLYVDEDFNSDMEYPLEIVSEGDADENGNWAVEVNGLYDLLNGYYGGEITSSTIIYYSGDYTDIYLSSPAAFSRDNFTQKSVSTCYCTTDSKEYRTNSSYIYGYQHEVTDGRGVIYRMVDELGNDMPFDFYNIQKDNYYWFQSERKTYQDRCYDNLVDVGLFAVKKKIHFIQGNTSTFGTKIYAPNGFDSVKLKSLSCNNIIYIGGSSSGTLATAKITLGNSTNNRMAISYNCVFEAGDGFNSNVVSAIGKTFTCGKNCTLNNFQVNTFIVEGDYVTRSTIRGNGHIRTEDTYGRLKASMLNFANIVLRGDLSNGEVLKVQYDGTTGSGIGLTGIVIRGDKFWRGKYAKTARTVVIPTTHTKDSFEDLTIASNSSGEIKVYSETDLVNNK